MDCGIKMTVESDHILNYTIPEDSRSENLQGKNFGKAQLYTGLHDFSTDNRAQYLLKIPKISRSDNT